MAGGINVGGLFATLTLDKGPFEKSLSGAGGSFSKFAGAVVKGAAVIGTAFIGFGVAAAHSADVQERADLRVRQSLGKSADAFIAWAKAHAAAFKANDEDIEQWAGTAVTAFKGVGFSQAAAVKMTQTLMTRAADIAAVTGKSFDEVFEALLKGTEGATRGLKGLGIVVDENEIKAKAMALGLYDGKGALDAGAKAAAIYQLALEKSASAAGGVEARAGSMGSILKTLPVVMDQILDTAGTVFLPIANAILPAVLAAFQGFAAWIEENLPAIQAVAQTVVDVIGAGFRFLTEEVIPPLLAVLAAIWTWWSENGPAIQAIAEQAFGAARDTIGALVDRLLAFLGEGNNLRDFLAALAVLVATIVVPAFLAWAAATIAATWPLLLIAAAAFLVFKALDDLGILEPLVQGATKALGDAAQWVGANALPILSAAADWLSKNVLPPLRDAFTWITTNVLPPLADGFRALAQVIVAAVNFFGPILRQVAEVLFPLIVGAARDLFDKVQLFFQLAGAAIRAIQPIVDSVVKGVVSLFGGMASGIGSAWNTATGLIRGALNFIIGLVNRFISFWDSIKLTVPTVDLGPLGTYGGFSISLPYIRPIPYLARGTKDWAGGFGVVGDRGPELVDMPPHSRVWPADQTRSILEGLAAGMGPGGQTIIGQQVAQQTITNTTPDEVELQLDRGLRRAALRLSLARSTGSVG